MWGLHRAYFSDLADGWSISFFDVASQICNNVDIMNLEVLQYSSKPFLFLDWKQRGITPCSSRIKTQISSKYFKIHSKSMASGHIHLKKIKIIGFKPGLAWKKYANHMQKNIWVWPFCGPKILLKLQLALYSFEFAVILFVCQAWKTKHDSIQFHPCLPQRPLRQVTSSVRALANLSETIPGQSCQICSN